MQDDLIPNTGLWFGLAAGPCRWFVCATLDVGLNLSTVGTGILLVSAGAIQFARRDALARNPDAREATVQDYYDLLRGKR